jgi:hypothetical protein
MTRSLAWLAALATLPLAVVGAAPAQAASTCSATYSIYSRSTDGDVMITLRNLSSLTSNHWTLTAEFPDTYTTTDYWGGTVTSPDLIGTVAMRNAVWNGAVAPSGTVSAGLRVSGSNWPAPLSLTCRMERRMAASAG